jgi:hypothetical protein
VGPLLVLTLLGDPIQDRAAKQSMLTGAGVSALCVLIEWTHAVHIPEATPLLLAWPCAFVEALRFRPATHLDSASSAESISARLAIAKRDQSGDSPSSIQDTA